MTGLEPATSGVTGRRSNQLSYTRVVRLEPSERIRERPRSAACAFVAVLITVVVAGCGGGGAETQEIGFGSGTSTFEPEPDLGSPGPPRVEHPLPQRGSAEKVFADNCGTCHTLRAAGTDARVGPNLDRLAPSTARVVRAIRNGGSGRGVMPANLLTRRDARRVAAYVTRVAGR